MNNEKEIIKKAKELLRQYAKDNGAVKIGRCRIGEKDYNHCVMTLKATGYRDNPEEIARYMIIFALWYKDVGKETVITFLPNKYKKSKYPYCDCKERFPEPMFNILP